MSEDMRIRIAKLLSAKVNGQNDPPEVYQKRVAEINEHLSNVKQLNCDLQVKTSGMSGYVSSVVSSSVAQMELASTQRLSSIAKEKAELVGRLKSFADEIRNYPAVIEISREVDWADVRRTSLQTKAEQLKRTADQCKQRHSQASEQARRLKQDLKVLLKENMRLKYRVDKHRQQRLNASQLQEPATSSSDPVESRHLAFIETLNNLRSELERTKALVSEERSSQYSKTEQLYSLEHFFKECLHTTLRSVLKTSLMSFEGNKALYFELMTQGRDSKAKANSSFAVHSSVTPDSFFGPNIGSKAVKSINRRLKLREKQATLRKMDISQADFMRFDLTQVIWLMSLRPDVTNLLHSAVFPRRSHVSCRSAMRNSPTDYY
jgi:chromosome segregation ATPase